MFKSLSENIVIITPCDYFIPLLEYDPLNIQDSNYYEEGKEHLKIDLGNEYKDFEWMEKAIKDYNEDLKNFEENGLENLIINYFSGKGFDVIDNSEIPTKDNTIVIKELIPMLKSCWYEQSIPFVGEYVNGYLKIIHNTIIAKVSADREQELRDCIEELKDYEKIAIAHKNLTDICNNIKQTSYDISKKIGKNIVIKIEKGVYKTICPDCSNL